MATGSLAYHWKTQNIAIKLIVINVLVFLLLHLGSFLFAMEPAYLTRWLVLPEEVMDFIVQPWSFLTYSFIHFDFFHLLFNMIWLHFFSRFVLNIFPPKKYLTIYLLGAMVGGLMYVLSYNVFPVFEGTQSYLIGASASVTAIMVFIATYTPNTAFRIFKWTIKLWHIALFIFIYDLIRLPIGGNAGGMLAHFGGAVFGYIYARQLLKGNDLGVWFENSMDWFSDYFKTKKQKPFKKVHRNKKGTSRGKSQVSDHQKKVDAILDKIGKSGYDSLTKAEKDFLFKAGKDN
ncbi:rhomboid family intramembrane serine protease [Patiriisocius sp. Uisw_047]|jgi:membrane associated rhomboid family serine protease|uniref:rhomboid family intramembrane serine protease n=1 Tax=Patiriisocius sp. Uisw_047 TaxID=3230969 RepID=UPI0039E7570B